MDCDQVVAALFQQWRLRIDVVQHQATTPGTPPSPAKGRSQGLSVRMRQRRSAGILPGMTTYPARWSLHLPGPWLAGLIFLGSLLPGLIALLPLTMGAGWYLSEDSNAPFLSAGVVWLMLSEFSIAIAPFLAAVVSLVSVGRVRRDLSLSLLISAAWAGGLGLVACVVAALSGGGF